MLKRAFVYLAYIHKPWLPFNNDSSNKAFTISNDGGAHGGYAETIEKLIEQNQSILDNIRFITKENEFYRRALDIAANDYVTACMSPHIMPPDATRIKASWYNRASEDNKEE